ncbi:hypothetical protein JCM8202_005711 [Rhodotorula sphaerocarpa]
MADPASGALLALARAAACAIAGVVSGILLATPLIALPALLSADGLSRRARLHVWSRLDYEAKGLVSPLLPLLSAALALCALLVRSDSSHSDGDDVAELGPFFYSLGMRIGENRRSLYVLASILILAIRPYSFGLITPRWELLRAEERRLLLLSLPRHSALDLALGRSTWRGATPTEEEEQGTEVKPEAAWVGRGGGDESADEDNDFREGVASDSANQSTVDTDRLIAELARLQLGPAILCGCAFLLVGADLVVCA